MTKSMVCLHPRHLQPSATKLVTYSLSHIFSKPFPLSKITNQVYFLSLTVVCTQWIWLVTDMPNSQGSMVETEEMSPLEWAGLWEWCKTVTKVLVRLSVWLEPLPRNTFKRNLSWKEVLAQEITYPTEIIINTMDNISPIFFMKHAHCSNSLCSIEKQVLFTQNNQIFGCKSWVRGRSPL